MIIILIVILKIKKIHPKHFHSIYIEMNGILPVKKMNNLTKLNIKLFHICFYYTSREFPIQNFHRRTTDIL